MTSNGPAGHADGRDRLVAVGRELEARQTSHMVGDALVAVGVEPRGDLRAPGAAPTPSRHLRSACVASIARWDLALDLEIAQRLVGLGPAMPHQQIRGPAAATRSPR